MITYILLTILFGPLLGAHWSPYCRRCSLGLDLYASALTGGLEGETLSGRAGSAYLQGKLHGKIFCPVIDILMWLVRAYPTPRGHCVAAIKGDIARAQAVILNQGGTL